MFAAFVPLQVVVQTGRIVLFGADHFLGIEFAVHAGLHGLEIVSLHGVEELLYGIFGLGAALAGCKTEDQGCCQEQRQDSFHNRNTSFILLSDKHNLIHNFSMERTV